MIYPVKKVRITSPYGERSFDKWHPGIDFGSEFYKDGDEILSITDGIVRVSKYNPGGFGHYVMIEHPQLGITSEYIHLQKRLVKVGQTVKEGEVIGLMGNTGASKGTHLHFGIRACLYSDPRFWKRTTKNGRKRVPIMNIDPMLYLEKVSNYPQWQDDLISWGMDKGLLSDYHKPDTPVTMWMLMSVIKNHLEKGE